MLNPIQWDRWGGTSRQMSGADRAPLPTGRGGVWRPLRATSRGRLQGALGKLQELKMEAIKARVAKVEAREATNNKRFDKLDTELATATSAPPAPIVPDSDFCRELPNLTSTE